MDTEQPTAVQTLLVVGAGAGDDLAAWRAQKPKRLVLVEPNPELARVLSKKIRAQTGEELITKACLAQDANTAGLQILSMALESGLYAPAKALRDFWPNITVTKTVQVEAESICSLVSGLGLNPHENNALILDAPGAEADLLQALMASPDSKVFSTISVRTAPKPLYESGARQETVETVLRSAFYDLKQVEESDVSPHITLSFSLDTRAALIAERDSKIFFLEQQLHDLAKAKDQEISAIEKRNQELAQSKDREITELRGELIQLSTARDALSKEKVDLIAARDVPSREKADLIASRDSLAKEKSDLSAKLATLQKQLEDQTAKTKALESTNQQLQSTNQELTSRHALLNEEIAKAEGQIELIKDLILRDEARL